ncbi:hypothetical protein C8F01DRAFT_1226683 [Mycena amicta]|nr:hypothetical protein C8F01DRAFT_1226683 [Mycena amicta]
MTRDFVDAVTSVTLLSSTPAINTVRVPYRTGNVAQLDNMGYGLRRPVTHLINRKTPVYGTVLGVRIPYCRRVLNTDVLSRYRAHPDDLSIIPFGICVPTNQSIIASSIRCSHSNSSWISIKTPPDAENRHGDDTMPPITVAMPSPKEGRQTGAGSRLAESAVRTMPPNATHCPTSPAYTSMAADRIQTRLDALQTCSRTL